MHCTMQKAAIQKEVAWNLQRARSRLLSLNAESVPCTHWPCSVYTKRITMFFGLFGKAHRNDRKLVSGGKRARRRRTPPLTLERLEDRLVPSAPANPAFSVHSDHSLWEQTTTGWQLLSPANTILSVSAVTNGAGQADAFAIAQQGQTLWEYTPAGWGQVSTGNFSAQSRRCRQPRRLRGQFGCRSAARTATNGSLWEYKQSVGVNVGWTMLSPAGTILSASAITDASGAPVVFAVTADRSLWEFRQFRLGRGGWALMSTGQASKQISRRSQWDGAMPLSMAC